MNSSEFEIDSKEKKQSKKFSIGPLAIHLSLLALLGILIVLFFYFDFSSEKETNVVLISNFQSFEEYVEVDELEVYSGIFTIQTDSGAFDNENKDILISNFKGTIKEENESIIIQGKADNISFSKNIILLSGKEFSLVSKEKTAFNFIQDSVFWNLYDGRFKFTDQLNVNYENATFSAKQVNFSASYDGTFSFNGFAKEFSLVDSSSNLSINYNS
jgi:hypothetical protein